MPYDSTSRLICRHHHPFSTFCHAMTIQNCFPCVTESRVVAWTSVPVGLVAGGEGLRGDSFIVFLTTIRVRCPLASAGVLHSSPSFYAPYPLSSTFPPPPPKLLASDSTCAYRARSEKAFSTDSPSKAWASGTPSVGLSTSRCDSWTPKYEKAQKPSFAATLSV